MGFAIYSARRYIFPVKNIKVAAWTKFYSILPAGRIYGGKHFFPDFWI